MPHPTPRLVTLVLVGAAGLFQAGCGGGTNPAAPTSSGEQEGPGGRPKTIAESMNVEPAPPSSKKPPAANTAAPPSEAGEEAVPTQPDDLPTLAELDARAEWIDRPVRDTLKMLRERQAGESPLATVDEALALRNTSREANAKIASALGRAATDDAQVDYEATFNRHSRVDVRTTNPILTSSIVESDINGLTAFGMFSFDWTMEPLATTDTVVSWQASRDGLVDKVVMRDDLTWSDGQPITAHDVVFSYLTIMNPKVPVPAQRQGTDKLRWVHAYDDRTVVYFHKEALATNVWHLNFSVIPKHIYEKSLPEDYTLRDSPHHVKYEESPVTGGPYVVTRRERGQEILLTRRESWYLHQGKQVRDKPYFKEVRFRILEDPNTALLALNNGEIDEIELNPELWMTQTTGDEFYRLNTKVTGPEWTYFQFLWNYQSPFFGDRRVREAMAYAFDYREMLDKLFYGLYAQSNGIFSPGAWIAPDPSPPYYQQDFDLAEQLLDEAGWEDHDDDGIRDREIDGELVKFEFGLLCPSIPERIKLCTLLKENLSQIGIICNVRPLEFAVMQEKLQNHEFEAAFGGWGTGANPDTSENIWGTGQERNYGHFSDSIVDDLYAQARNEFDRTKRGRLYARIAERIYADQPATFLYYRNSFYAFSKQLRGYTFSPRGPYHFGPGIGSIYKAAK